MLRKSATFIDQLIVSGGNFLLTILLVRALELEDFGLFSFSWLIVISLASIVQAVFIAPLLSFCPKFNVEEKEAFRALVLVELITSLFIIGTISLLLLFILLNIYGSSEVTDVLFGVILLSIPYYLYEFLRRDMMLRGKNLQLMLSDAFCYSLMLISIILISDWELHAIFVLISSCFTVTLFFFIYNSKFNLLVVIKEIKAYRPLIKKQFEFSKWLVKSAVLQFFNGNFYMFAVGFVLGSAQIGYIKLAQNIVGIINPIYAFLDNHAQLYLSKIKFDQGDQSCMAQYKKVAAMCMCILLLVLCVMFILKAYLIDFLYGKQPNIVYDYLTLMLLLSALTGANFLERLIAKVNENTQAIFKSYLFSSILSLLVVYPLITIYGGLAAVQAMIIAQIVMLFIMLHDRKALSNFSSNKGI